MNENQNSIEKSFTLKFLKQNPSIDFEEKDWQWQPAKKRNDLNIQTATFSGKNKADDYTNE